MPDTRSLSGDLEDSDVESHADHPNGSNKPGRKKSSNSQAARRDQNRIAQREFRLRKQQRIRDLEARVEILSGGQDEALSEVRNILKDLMQENQTLRNLLRSLSSFIGDGAGGLLPKLGWDMTEFNDFVNRSETDTAWESYQRRKKQTTEPPAPQVPKRTTEDDADAPRPKRPRGMSDQDSASGSGTGGHNFSLLAPPPNVSVPSTPEHTYPTGSRPQGKTLFSELMRDVMRQQMFMPSLPNPSYHSPSSSSFPQVYMPPMDLNVDPLPYQSVPNGTAQHRPPPPQASPTSNVSPDMSDKDDDPARSDTYKLIHYHLESYKKHTAYCLPASLRPTLVQRSVPHESFIDRVLHPELRDRIILLRGQFELIDCLYDYHKAVTIHGDDVLAHANWEIGESWLRRYGFLVDQATLNISNRWRSERGETELLLSDIAPQEHGSGST